MKRSLRYKHEVLSSYELCDECQQFILELWQIAMYESKDEYEYNGEQHTVASFRKIHEAMTYAQLLGSFFVQEVMNTKMWKQRINAFTDDVILRTH